MTYRPLDDTLVTSPQIMPEQVAGLAAAGFRAIICNRPDGEEAGQPDVASIRAAAEQSGLAFVHIPVAGGGFPSEAVIAMAQALETLPGPIFGYCRSGMRTTVLWALARAGKQDTDSLIIRAAQAGYDLNPLRPALEARHPPD